jgi:hypothetical protein
MPGPGTGFVRGKSGYVPFWPGGLDDVLIERGDLSAPTKGIKGLRTVPPGFSRGFHLPGDEVEDESLLALDEMPDLASHQEYEMVFTRFHSCLYRLLLPYIYELCRIAWSKSSSCQRRTRIPHSLGRNIVRN